MNLSIGNKNIRYALLVIVMFVATITYSIQSGMHKNLPEPLGHTAVAIAIAISELEYGTSGYAGYRQVLDVLMNNGMTVESSILKRYNLSSAEIYKSGTTLNNAIGQVFSMDKPAGSRKLYRVREDIGEITYYKIAMKVFGYKIQSFTYLYYLIFLASIVVYIATFHRQQSKMLYLFAFTCGHFVIITTLQDVGTTLLTVNSRKLLPVLAILPSIHIAILIFSKTRITMKHIIGATIQASIVAFMVHARAATIYEIMFLVAFLVLLIIWFVFKNYQVKEYVFSRIKLLPVFIALGLFILFQLYTYISLDSGYGSYKRGHLFWHAAYMGLATHPEGFEKYGLLPTDVGPQEVAKKRNFELYGTRKYKDYTTYESLLKEAYFELLKKDPIFVAESYLYKPFIFLSKCFDRNFMLNKFFFLTLIFVVVVVAVSATNHEMIFSEIPELVGITLLALLFSLLPMLLTTPEYAAMGDPAIFITTVIYLLVALATVHAMRLVEKYFSSLK
jgi:hypothetical protein